MSKQRMAPTFHNSTFQVLLLNIWFQQNEFQTHFSPLDFGFESSYFLYLPNYFILKVFFTKLYSNGCKIAAL